jgi:hypothetical protein
MLSRMHPVSSAATDRSELDAMQREIWLAKIARARAMTPDERVAEISSLTTQAFARMHAAAMADLGTTDADAGWAEVRRRVERLRAARDAGRFIPMPSAAAR